MTRRAGAAPIGTHSSPELMDRREAVRRAALLLGATLSAPAVASVLASCEAAQSKPGSWTPRALAADQLEQVATIAEHIIPATETPGARAAGVDRFIDTMLAEYYTRAEREQFLAGLAETDVRARRAHGRAFLRCTDAQQRAVLEQLDRETFAPTATQAEVANQTSRETERGGGGLAVATADTGTRDPGRGASAHPPFFRTMKELTLLGYYTSQPGATQELRYVQVPGRFDGCIPFSKVGRTWAT
ncbi:MAG TPA: gluconate 2-dehydrogenase subunit 3 family protein [Gemmatimonadaceae bacterium]|nr:gluconate 2-dehydrogenase subunit 3 family protein [Gemmatimonadaceae bacterium]